MLVEGARVVTSAIAECSVEERTDPGLMKERIRTEVRRFPEETDGPAADGAAGGDGDLRRD